jgi:antitoxin component YwqK of YwqJK toxin-antitoxin module
MQGEGILIFPSGGLYFGRFDRNKLHGVGLIYYRNGDLICGSWRQSKLQGLVYKYKKESDLWLLAEYENGIIVSYKKEERTINKIYGFKN